MLKKTEWLLLGGLTLLILLASLNWAIRATIHSQKDIVVPDLSGKPLFEALDILSKLNLAVKQDGAELNDTVPLGTVLRQQPPAGMSVREGKTIRVTLSQGGETIFVPDLTGQSLRSAEIALRLNSLSLGEVRSRPSLKYEKDVVLSQEPASKTISQKNALVHVMVSEGAPQEGQMLMPDFVGKYLDEASNWSKDSGVKIETSEEESPQDNGIVLKQSVQPDDLLQPESTVHLTISKKSGNAPAGPKFHFEVPQGESAKEYSFVLVDKSKSQEIWKGKAEPGSKLDIPLPAQTSSGARIRILINGNLTEERAAQ